MMKKIAKKHAEIRARNLAICTRIDFLVKQHGYEVSTELLDTYDIELSHSLSFTLEESGILTSTFFKHKIVSNPKNGIHKIYNI